MKAIIRTVRNGTVKIGGHRYQAESAHKPYDGRLDGLRLVFGRYAAPWLPGGFLPYVSLWGSERRYHGDESHLPEVVDGSLPWMTWHFVAHSEKGKKR